MRYLVRARVKPDREAELLQTIEAQTLGKGSVGEGEYLRNMQDARLCSDQTARWVEVCYCPTPLEEERPYWEQYFELTRVQDAHDRRRCRDQNGSKPWACGDCDCTARLEQKLKALDTLESQFYEGGANGSAELIPSDPAKQQERRREVRARHATRSENIAKRFRVTLADWYGKEKADTIRHAEAFEICEYGRRPEKEELRKLFPFIEK